MFENPATGWWWSLMAIAGYAIELFGG